MKVERKKIEPNFEPINLILETEEEVEILKTLLHGVICAKRFMFINQFCKSLLDKLKELENV